MVAALAADALGMAIAAFEGCGTGSNQCVRIGFRTYELGQRSLTHRPPGKAAIKTLLYLLEVVSDGEPVLRGVEGLVHPTQSFEPGLQRRLGLSTVPVPGLEVVEQGPDLEERISGSPVMRTARSISKTPLDSAGLQNEVLASSSIHR